MKVAIELQPCLKNKSGIRIYTYEPSKRLSQNNNIQLTEDIFNFLNRNDISKNLEGLTFHKDMCNLVPFYTKNILWKEKWNWNHWLPPEMVKKCLNRISRKLSRMVLRRGKGSNPFSLVDYTSSIYQKATEQFINSYSKKAYTWDNACIESFHALIKREWLNRFKITDYNHAYRLVFAYIDTFYNTVRIHSHSGYVSPSQYKAIYSKELEDYMRR